MPSISAPRTAAAAATVTSPGAAFGPPRLILRAEGVAMLIAATTLYSRFDLGWGLFALLFLVPDLSMAGYLFGRRIGAHAYNLGHSYLGPALLAAIGIAVQDRWMSGIALIWIAHIGFDRAVGYGLKYQTAFGDTHLGLPFARQAL